jgi:hypothetical protein
MENIRTVSSFINISTDVQVITPKLPQDTRIKVTSTVSPINGNTSNTKVLNKVVQTHLDNLMSDIKVFPLKSNQDARSIISSLNSISSTIRITKTKGINVASHINVIEGSVSVDSYQRINPLRIELEAVHNGSMAFSEVGSSFVSQYSNPTYMEVME